MQDRDSLNYAAMVFSWTCNTVLLKSVGALMSTEAWGTAKQGGPAAAIAGSSQRFATSAKQSTAASQQRSVPARKTPFFAVPGTPRRALPNGL